MSFRLQPTPPARPNRCQLFGPGSNTKLFAKMAASAADVINLDLEDSVAPNDKDMARANVIEAINTVDWGNKTLSVRINSLDTPYWYRDVVDLLEQASERLDQIMIPKVGCAEDVYAVDALVSAIEAAKGRKKRIAFEVIIESAAGIAHVEAIAASSPRLEAMSLGAADFAASMGMQTTGIGGTQENYYMLHDGPIHGTGRKPQSSPPAVPTASCLSMAPSVTSQMMRVAALKHAAPPPSAWSENGRSTPNRLPSATKSSPHQRKPSPRPAKSLRQWKLQKPTAKVQPYIRAAWSTSPPSNRPKSSCASPR